MALIEIDGLPNLIAWQFSMANCYKEPDGNGNIDGFRLRFSLKTSPLSGIWLEYSWNGDWWINNGYDSISFDWNMLEYDWNMLEYSWNAYSEIDMIRLMDLTVILH